MRLADLSWPQVEEASKTNPVVIVPLGTVEAHGPGLPLDVDAHTVSSIAEAVGKRTGARVTPVVVPPRASDRRRSTDRSSAPAHSDRTGPR